ncbi:uncharacterized protein LOC131882253 isoform X3 [Tigriopus californicus]|uniref:uncharacterized protein LOC131882253 isoform X3 n=1 Tax=Tigriopus californicus TaxID=6832 RepID=UPI0027D9DB87|nr:uncharacterized protein LOC131882253 isoform X3 [Tigriopus californicus]
MRFSKTSNGSNVLRCRFTLSWVLFQIVCCAKTTKVTRDALFYSQDSQREFEDKRILFEEISHQKLWSNKSPLWRDENLYFQLPLGYASLARGFSESRTRTTESQDPQNRDGNKVHTLNNRDSSRHVVAHIDDRQYYDSSNDYLDTYESEDYREYGSASRDYPESPSSIELKAREKEGYAILGNVLDYIRDQDRVEVVHYPEIDSGASSSRPQASPLQSVPYIIQPTDVLAQNPEFQSILAELKHSIESPSSTSESITSLFSLVYQNRYVFLLGVIPLTLSSLFLLGHAPFQILLIGAYSVTVYLFSRNQEADKLRRLLERAHRSSHLTSLLDPVVLPELAESLIWSILTDDKGQDELSNTVELRGNFREMLRQLKDSLFAQYFSPESLDVLHFLSNFVDQQLEKIQIMSQA